MKLANIFLGIIIIVIAILLIVFSEGLLLPLILPLGFWGLTKLGVKT